MSTPERPRRRQQILSIDLGAKLIGVVETLRRQIQDHIGTSRSISRGDVVRLAIRRLELACLARAADDPAINAEAVMLWMDAAADLRISGTCPDFLVPDSADSPVLAPKNPGRKKNEPARRKKAPG